MENNNLPEKRKGARSKKIIQRGRIDEDGNVTYYTISPNRECILTMDETLDVWSDFYKLPLVEEKDYKLKK